jgi:hypothetical protein
MRPDVPELPRKLHLRNLIFETWREVVPRVELAQPAREGAFEISQVGAPIDMLGIGFDKQVQKVHRAPPADQRLTATRVREQLHDVSDARVR